MEVPLSGWDLFGYMDKGTPLWTKMSWFISQFIYMMSSLIYMMSELWVIFDLEEVTSQLIFSCFLTWEQPSFYFIVWRIEWGATDFWAGPHPLGHMLFASFTLEPVPSVFLFLCLCKTCFVLIKKKGLNEIIYEA